MKLTNRRARKTFSVVIPGKIEDIVDFTVDDFSVSPLEALNRFYNSMVYQHLEKEETKYWHRGSVTLYNEFAEQYLKEKANKS